jgi:hypothetical protein
MARSWGPRSGRLTWWKNGLTEPQDGGAFSLFIYDTKSSFADQNYAGGDLALLPPGHPAAQHPTGAEQQTWCRLFRYSFKHGLINKKDAKI